ncbi:MAG: PspA/IM30 family protein [Spirochaetales bacterium]|jgi:phage shock protein A|nr:PspA/IM30 family protein [Spirochaetales bacterium]
MGIFTRFKDIVNANINSMLDKAEDPEKMIRLMMQEMEDTMVDLKANCAEKMGLLKTIQREKDRIDELLQRWEGRAKLAVSSGKDDLAREALLEKQRCQNDKLALDREKLHLEAIIEESKHQIQLLGEKLEQVNQKHRLLVQRGIHAQEKKRVRENLYQAAGTEAMRRFEEMESRIERMEAEADIAGETFSSRERDFNRMENEEKIEAELEALKQKIKDGSRETN